MSHTRSLTALLIVAALAGCSNDTPADTQPTTTVPTTTVPTTTVPTTSVAGPSTTVSASTTTPATTPATPSAASKFDVPYSVEDAELVDRAAPVVETWLKTLWRDARNIPFEYTYTEFWRDVAHHDTANTLFTGPANIAADADVSAWAPNQAMDLRGVLWYGVVALEIAVDDPEFANSWTLLSDPLLKLTQVDTAQFLNTALLSDPPTVDRTGSAPVVVWPVFIEVLFDYGDFQFTVERHFAVELTDNAAGEMRIIREHDLGAAEFVASTNRVDLVSEGVVLEPPLEPRPTR